MAKKNAREEPPSPGPQVSENVQMSDIVFILDKMELLLKAVPVSEYRSYDTPLYWMDFGNTQASGLYETVASLKVVTRLVKYARVKESDSGPSCSLAEALKKQDLFINSTLAQLGCNILWKMFRHGMIEHHGLYLNLETLKTNPILV